MIKKVVIPVAGLGTRFLPFTKSVPKEMLPVVDSPSILLLVEEAYRAGFTDIVLVQGRGKVAIEDFFDVSYELERILEQKQKANLLERIHSVRENINIISVRQKQAMGLGHAILTARPIVGNAPFAVMLGDEIMSDHKDLEALRDNYIKSGVSTVSVMEVPRTEVCKYGIVKVKSVNQGIIQVDSLVEKPNINEAPSLYALPGRYVFNQKIFDYLEETKPGVGGEIQLTDAMVQLAQNEGLQAMPIRAKRYDLGDKFGFLHANIEYGLNDPELGGRLRSYLKEIQLGL